MEILFVLFKQSTYLVCVATPKSRWQTRSRTRKTGTSENMERVGRIILSPRSLTCHPTRCPHKDRMHSEIHFTTSTKLESTCTQVRRFFTILENRCRVVVFIHKARDLISADWYLVFHLLPPPFLQSLFVFSLVHLTAFTCKSLINM